MDDLIESVCACIRCGDETCGGECMDPRDPWDVEFENMPGVDPGVK